MYKPSQSSEVLSQARTQGKGLIGNVMDRSRVANVRLDNFLSSHGIKQGSTAYPELDVAIFKATNHEETIPKEKHVRTIKEACQANQGAYVIAKLDQRFQDSNYQWLINLKILMVFHRMMRDAMVKDFMKDVVQYASQMGNNNFLRMENFSDLTAKDTWDYASWVRSYSGYVWEKYQCFKVSNFNCEKEATGENSRFLTLSLEELIVFIPTMLRIMRKFQNCMPEGRSQTDAICLMGYKWVLVEGGKTQRYLQEGIQRLVENYFEFEKPDAVKVLDIVREYNSIVDRFPEYWAQMQQIQAVKNSVLWGDNLYTIPPDMTQQMEDHVKDAPTFKALPAGPQTTGEKPRSQRRRALIGPVGQAQTVLEGTGIGFEKNRPLAITGGSFKPPAITYNQGQTQNGAQQPGKVSELAKKGIVAAPEMDLLNFDDMSLNDNPQASQQQGGVDMLGQQNHQNHFGDNAFGGEPGPLQITNFPSGQQPTQQGSDLLNDQFNPNYHQQGYGNQQGLNNQYSNYGGSQQQGQGQGGALVVYGQQQPQNNSNYQQQQQQQQQFNSLGHMNTTGQTHISSPFVSNNPSQNQNAGQGGQQPQQIQYPGYGGQGSMNMGMGGQQPNYGYGNSLSVTGAVPQQQQQRSINPGGHSYTPPNMVSPNNQKLVVDMNTGLRKPQDPLEMLNQDLVSNTNPSQTSMNQNANFPSGMLRDQTQSQAQAPAYQPQVTGYNSQYQQPQNQQYSMGGQGGMPQQGYQNQYQPQVTGYNYQNQQQQNQGFL